MLRKRFRCARELEIQNSRETRKGTARLLRAREREQTKEGRPTSHPSSSSSSSQSCFRPSYPPSSPSRARPPPLSASYSATPTRRRRFVASCQQRRDRREGRFSLHACRPFEGWRRRLRHPSRRLSQKLRHRCAPVDRRGVSEGEESERKGGKTHLGTLRPLTSTVDLLRTTFGSDSVLDRDCHQRNRQYEERREGKGRETHIR
jgi:hypothetical protein